MTKFYTGHRLISNVELVDVINGGYSANKKSEDKKENKQKPKKITAYVSSDGEVFRYASEMIKYSEENLGEKFKKCKRCDGKGYVMKDEEYKNPKYIDYGWGNKMSEYQTECEYITRKVKKDCYCLGGYEQMKQVPITETIIKGYKWE